MLWLCVPSRSASPSSAPLAVVFLLALPIDYVADQTAEPGQHLAMRFAAITTAEPLLSVGDDDAQMVEVMPGWWWSALGLVLGTGVGALLVSTTTCLSEVIVGQGKLETTCLTMPMLARGSQRYATSKATPAIEASPPTAR